MLSFRHKISRLLSFMNILNPWFQDNIQHPLPPHTHTQMVSLNRIKREKPKLNSSRFLLFFILAFGLVQFQRRVGDDTYSTSNDILSLPLFLSLPETIRCQHVQNFQSVMHPMGTDKTSIHGYQWFYGPAFAPYRHLANLRVLEIGAREGRSVAGWTNYFANVQVDIMTYGGKEDNLQFTRMECELGDCSKVERFYGDQSDTDFLESVITKRPDGWDIIIDDASVSPIQWRMLCFGWHCLRLHVCLSLSLCLCVIILLVIQRHVICLPIIPGTTRSMSQHTISLPLNTYGRK